MLRSALRKLCIAFGCLPISGCYSPPVQFHELAMPPSARDPQHDLGLPFDAYVIGVEKNNRARIGTVDECLADGPFERCLNVTASYYVSNSDLLSELEDKYRGQWRPTFVSHIARFDGAQDGSPCFIYNFYAVNDKADFCVGAAPIVPAKKMAVYDSWTVLDALRADIKLKAQQVGATHLIVYAMGWNTPQWEALQNFRALFGNLQRAAEASGATSFRPLFFGITWPSTGDPRIPGSDYGIKAKDADEVGAIWGNLLVNRVLAGVKKDLGLPIVIVGHSFGARATSRAVFSAPLVSPPEGHMVDLLISLQGAYSYQRFVPSANDGKHTEPEQRSAYRDYATRAETVVLTASMWDEAVTKALHAPYFAGSAVAYANSKEPPANMNFDHVVAESSGKLPLVGCRSGKVLYVEASQFIKDRVKGTGGRAHSDIYDEAAAVLTAQLIQECAPGTAWVRTISR